MTRRKSVGDGAPGAPQRKRNDPLPIEVDAVALPPLGMPPAEFLRDYWQKRPLLIRNAFPGFVSPIAPEDLAGLACGFWESRDEISSQWRAQRVFEPSIGADERAGLMAQWQRAVTRSLGWASPA